MQLLEDGMGDRVQGGIDLVEFSLQTVVTSQKGGGSCDAHHYSNVSTKPTAGSRACVNVSRKR